MRMVAIAVFAGAVAAAPASADDVWDVQGTADDSAATENRLGHGDVQRNHDLAGTSNGTIPTDQDWFLVRTKARHSYEGRIHSTTDLLDGGGGPTAGALSRFDRVDATGAILTAGVRPPTDDNPNNPGSPIFEATLVVRWEAVADGNEFLRARGLVLNGLTLSPQAQYDVDFFDTTYFAPRWNNAGGQVTILLVQNQASAVVNGSVHFYDGAGTLLHTHPLAVPVFGLQAIHTAAIPALAGQAGSATIAHTGGWGALSGKAVALEPSTGFSFDTPFTSVPR